MATPNGQRSDVGDDTLPLEEKPAWPVPPGYRIGAPASAAERATPPADPSLDPAARESRRSWLPDRPAVAVLGLLAIVLALTPWLVLSDGSATTSSSLRLPPGSAQPAGAPVPPRTPADGSARVEESRAEPADARAGTRITRRDVAVTVLDVVGMTAADAVGALRESGLRPVLRLVRSGERAGTVVAQRPRGGSSLDQDSVVTLRVARPAPLTVEVPQLVGLDRSSAVARVKALGLRWRMTEMQSDRPRGVVVAQSPAGGTHVERGAAVNVEVSSGPGRSVVPDVTGLDVVSARHQLEAAGFVAAVEYVPTSDPAEEGIVLWQSPSGGAREVEGTPVTLSVGMV